MATTITENKGSSFVTVKIESKYQSEVQKAVDQYVKDFPQEGYMTEVKSLGKTDDGVFYAKLVRYASCD